MKNQNLEDRCPHWDEKGDRYDHECWIAPVHIPCSGKPEGGYRQCWIYLENASIDPEKIKKKLEEMKKQDAALDKYLEENYKNRKKC